ncbi:MAG: quinolinate synthase NadA [Phycisphaerae bacterium]|nr:quinolinate synthase NadA [Phycisphaerae bacterium]NIP53430.1 quinolinate synthase NadA [Phycisphaerae bacterium]NIS52680.1 quinolinate synthase NadA [Phycisphaerae bacterium]NIU09922.1 quinolinate synthase NadA [Phycisphaerae bacterium]NIU57660.1 quinolinate synthase NadA [Phycisphaerae bacterium]
MSQQIIEKINKLKDKHNAVILAHNYQPPEIQDIADFGGDSLGLSIKAAETDADVIVFCGVRFMAETAAILSPDKTILLPDEQAGCPMADMITADQLQQLKQKHPDALVVCYVNSSAEVKAESDYCCTSANAVEVVDSLPKDKQIIFVPDQHLGRFVIERTKRDLILWPGYCHVHVVITGEDIENAKARHPDAVVMAHPECTETVKALSDQLLSTGQMLRFVAQNRAKKFIIATEVGIIHTLKKQNPQAEFIFASENAICPNMKKISLEKLLWSLQDLQCTVTVPKDIRIKAKKALDRMVEILPAK